MLNRRRRVDRDELLGAVYGEDAPPDYQLRLSVLLSKLRRAIGSEPLQGRAHVELVLPADAFVDVEAAFAALHRAESHVAHGEWAEAWGPTGVAHHVASRPLLQGHDSTWLDEWRRRLEEVRVRGLECFAAARLGLGGPTLPQAAECARRLIELAPFRETGYRILMEALERSGNIAEALRVYDRLRLMLHDELGIAPSPAVQRVYRRLLGETTASTRLDLLGLGEDVLARDLPDEIRMVGGQMLSGFSPERVVGFALDDLAAHAVDSLHEGIVGPRALWSAGGGHRQDPRGGAHSAGSVLVHLDVILDQSLR